MSVNGWEQSEPMPEEDAWKEIKVALDSQNDERAIWLLTRMAENGDWRATTSLGYLYEAMGKRDPANYIRAAHWYSRALAQNDVPAPHLALARYYFFGLGGDCDFERAVGHLLDVSYVENPQAALMMAELYLVGGGVRKDLSRAKDLFSRLASSGYPAGFLGLRRVETAQGNVLRALVAHFRGLLLLIRIVARDKTDPHLIGTGGSHGNFRRDVVIW